MSASRIVHLKPRGGMLDTPQESSLQPGYAEELLNYWYATGSWKKRSGFSKIHATAFSDSIRGIGALKEVSATDFVTLTVIVATKGVTAPGPIFYKIVAGVPVALPINGVLAPPASLTNATHRWRHAETSNTVSFWCRRAAGSLLYHVTKDQVTAAGIAAPTSAPTVADSAGAGALPGGVYGTCCYTFFTADQQESSASPTTSATIGASKKRAWSGLEVSPHPRVVGRRLYVPRASGVIPYETIDIPNNTATTFEEDVLDANLGQNEAPTRNGVPPDGPMDCFKFQEQLVVMNDEGWWWSDFDQDGPLFEAFDRSRLIRLAALGGRRPTGGLAFDEDRAVLFTDASAHWMVPDGDGYRPVDLSPDHGMPAPPCAAACDGVLVWFDGRNVCRSDGGAARVVSRGWVDKVLAQMNTAFADHAVSVWHSEKGLWKLSIPSTSTSIGNDLVLNYDVARDEWSTEGGFWTGSAHYAPEVYARIPTSDKSEWITVAGFDNDNRVMRIDSTTRRDEGPINVHGKALCAPIMPAIPGGQIIVRRVGIGVDRRRDIASYTPTSEPTLTVRLLLDGNRYTGTVTATRNGNDQYVRAPAQNVSDPAAYAQIEWEEDFDNFVEFFDVWAEVVDLARAGGRS